MAIHRELTLEDYWPMLLRRRLLIVVPAILCAMAGYLVSRALPKQYTSHTLVLVEQPTVPGNYVTPVVSQGLNQRLASMQEQILSRTRLRHLVEQFSLYKEGARHVPMEEEVERLRKSIAVTPLHLMPGTQSSELPGFNVDVTLGEARLAQQICTEITSMFMEQNLRLRQQQAEDTTHFLDKQLQEAKTKLDEQDAKLADFQTRYIGELPEDEKTNLTLLMGMAPQLDAATQALNQAQQEKAFTESQLSQQLAAWKSSHEGENFPALEEQLGTLQSRLLSLQGRYTEEHPDVVKLKNDIATLRKLQNGIPQASAQDPSPSVESKTRPPTIEPAQIQQLRAYLKQVELTISQKTRGQEQLQKEIRTLQSRIQLSPIIQQEFKALTRDYQSALNFYGDLLKKRNESQMATELEHRQQSEQFRVLDPPNLPERPSFPKTSRFVLGGLGAGLAFGLGMVYLSELRDKSIRTKRDIEFYLGMPTLALVSSIEPTRRKKNGTHGKALQQRILSSVRRGCRYGAAICGGAGPR